MIGFLVFSSLHIVVGEQVPKTLAIREPEPVLAVDRLSARTCAYVVPVSAQLAARRASR